MEVLLYFLIGVVGVCLFGFLYFENKSIVTKRHLLKFEFLPKEFDGFMIAHLSDLHNKWFGNNQKHLVFAVRETRPDIIVITGDIVDESFYFDEEPALSLVRQLSVVAPIYYVSGNHEWSRPEYGSFREQLIDLGVHVLDNRSETITRNDRTITISGIDDPARYRDEIAHEGWLGMFRRPTGRKAADMQRVIHRELDIVRQGIDERAFKILLVHRPEWFREYMEYHFNLIFAGHAHGGQWNLPGMGPIFAPGQGLFPKLVSGAHKRHSTYMVVSRGLGNSGILAFQRLFNRPEIVVVVLKNQIGK